MKTGYPFLAIFKKHNLPYEDVLMAADYCKNMDSTCEGYRQFMDLPNEAAADVNKAIVHFTGQQAGLIEMTDYVSID